MRLSNFLNNYPTEFYPLQLASFFKLTLSPSFIPSLSLSLFHSISLSPSFIPSLSPPLSFHLFPPSFIPSLSLSLFHSICLSPSFTLALALSLTLLIHSPLIRFLNLISISITLNTSSTVSFYFFSLSLI